MCIRDSQKCCIAKKPYLLTQFVDALSSGSWHTANLQTCFGKNIILVDGCRLGSFIVEYVLATVMSVTVKVC